MDQEGNISHQGPIYAQLADADRRLELFATNGAALRSRYDESPPPYASRSPTPSYHSDNERLQEATEEVERSIREAGERHAQRHAADPYHGLTLKERARVIKGGRRLREAGRERKEEKKRREDEWWASRPKSTRNIFSGDSSEPQPLPAHNESPLSTRPPRNLVSPPQRKKQLIQRGSGQSKIVKKTQEVNNRRSKRLSAQSLPRDEPDGLRRSARLAERAHKEAEQRRGQSGNPSKSSSKPPVTERRQRKPRR